MLSIHSGASPALLASGFDVGLNQEYPAAIAAWRIYAASQLPNEAVGLILTSGDFVPLRNVHPNPRDHFATDLAEVAPYQEVIAGVVHSHTPGKGEDPTLAPTVAPSKADMEGQVATAVPWGISLCQNDSTSVPIWWGDDLPVRPLVGRTFVHGIMDCYSLIRDMHRLHGIVIPEFPRDDKWWEAGEDMYVRYFEIAGFQRVARDPKAGDCFLCALHSEQLNHAGMFITDDTFIHHPGGYLSLRSIASRWRSKMTLLVRHKDFPEDWTCSVL